MQLFVVRPAVVLFALLAPATRQEVVAHVAQFAPKQGFAVVRLVRAARRAVEATTYVVPRTP